MDTSTYYIFQFFIQQSNKNNKQSYYKEVYLAHPVECLKTGINLFLPSVPTVFSLIMYRKRIFIYYFTYILLSIKISIFICNYHSYK